MDMYIPALEPAPATLGPRSGGCLAPEPEAGGHSEQIAPISLQIWDAKYRLKAHDGTPIDVTIEDSWRRVARALAAAENPEQWEARFYQALEDFRFLPAGRILAGAGTGRHVTLFNCFVMGNVEDDLGSIFSHLREAALTMQQGGGIGYDFSSLRPKGAPVKGVGADAFGCRCPSWMYGTRCAAPSCPSAPAAAP
jgi:ribonucleoside-diphosphate reductase alpha chain